jgi:hypothetical protein
MLILHLSLIGSAILLIFIAVPADESPILFTAVLTGVVLWAGAIWGISGVMALVLWGFRGLVSQIPGTREWHKRTLAWIRLTAVDMWSKRLHKASDMGVVPPIKPFLDQACKDAGYRDWNEALEHAKEKISDQEWAGFWDTLQRRIDRRIRAAQRKHPALFEGQQKADVDEQAGW